MTVTEILNAIDQLRDMRQGANNEIDAAVFSGESALADMLLEIEPTNASDSAYVLIAVMGQLDLMKDTTEIEADKATIETMATALAGVVKAITPADRLDNTIKTMSPFLSQRDKAILESP